MPTSGPPFADHASVESDRGRSPAGRHTLGEPARRRQAVHESSRAGDLRNATGHPRREPLLTYKSAVHSDLDAVKAFCAIDGYIVGFVMFEIGVVHATDSGAPTVDQLAAAIPGDDCPCFMSSLPYLVRVMSTSASSTGSIC